MEPFSIFRLSSKPDDFALKCDREGLSLAGVPLLRFRQGRFMPRPLEETGRLLDGAYGVPGVGARAMSGLRIVAIALNEGELTKAMVAALLLKLSPLDQTGAARIRQADRALAKDDPAEPRDWRGRWTEAGIADDSTQALALRSLKK